MTDEKRSKKHNTNKLIEQESGMLYTQQTEDEPAEEESNINDIKETYLVYQIKDDLKYEYQEQFMSAFDNIDDARKYIEEMAKEGIAKIIKEKKGPEHLMLDNQIEFLEKLESMEYRWSVVNDREYVPFIGEKHQIGYVYYQIRAVELNKKCTFEEIRKREFDEYK